MNDRKLVFVFLFIAATSLATAQGKLDDYLRAEASEKLFANKIFNNPKAFHWLPESDRFWYVNTTRAGKRFMIVDVTRNSQKEIFDHARMAVALSQFTKKEIDGSKLSLHSIEFVKERNAIQFLIDTVRFECDLGKYKVKKIHRIEKQTKYDEYWANLFDETNNPEVVSPDSLWTAFIKDHNLVVKDRNSKQEFQMSFDGSSGNFYSSYIMWSPDSKKLMAYKVRPAQKRLIHFVRSSPDSQLQPILESREYLKPGDELSHRQPQLFLLEEKKHVQVSDELFSRQYFLEEIRWRADSQSFTFEYNERGHQRYRVIEINAATGTARTIITEESKTFIDYSSKKYRYDVEDGKEIIWASERDGWNHLYRYDGLTGNVINQITKGEWVVRGVEKVDENGKKIIFSASGLDKDQDPYLIHYCVINFDGTGFRRLTTSDANHTAFFSPDYKYFVKYSSRVDLEPSSSVVRTSDAKERMPIQKADVTDLYKAGWKAPEVFHAKGRDGTTDIWGIVIRPSNFDPGKKYPVIEEIYAGPHGFNVPKHFNERHRGINSLAELGFIVVMIDGMGTSSRSKAFHDVAWKNLKDAGFPDRIEWMKAAAKKYPFLDITKVGIYGGSAGGQNAAGAVLFYPEFYDAAVASCGSHDNRMDKIWWNEQWMGYPVGPHYAESSNAVNAHKLGGKLMLIVGEVDDNVDPASTMQVANALIRANKDFDLVVLPGFNHTGGGEFGERKRRDFFVKHLLDIDPPAWEKVYGSPPIQQ